MEKKRRKGTTISLLLSFVMAISLLSTPALAVDTGRKEFADVSPDAWYYEAVTTVTSDRLMSWYSDGNFRPDKAMTVSDIIAALNKAFYGVKMPTSAKEHKAYNWESVSWVPAGFTSDYLAKATRKQACALLDLAMGQTIPADGDPIEIAVKSGYIGSYGEADSPFTRAQLASVLYGMMYGIAAEPMSYLVLDFQLEGFSEEEIPSVRMAMNQALAVIPENLKRSFSENGYTLYGATKEKYVERWRSFTALGDPSNSSGMFLEGKKVMLVNNMVPETVSHEFGHYLMTLGDQDTILTLYKEEQSGISAATGRTYGCTTPEEFFAEGFRCYCTRSMNLRWIPKTAAYIESLLKTM